MKNWKKNLHREFVSKPLTKANYFCIEYLKENLSNSYEVAESIEIVNLTGINSNKTSFSKKEKDSSGSDKDDSFEKEELNTSRSDWTETYKEIFESK